MTESADAPQSDWASQLVDSLDSVIDAVRSKTTDPVRMAARIAVFAVTIIGLALATFFLLVIGSIRLLDRYLPGGVWAPYLLLGGIFGVIAMLVWSRRHA